MALLLIAIIFFTILTIVVQITDYLYSTNEKERNDKINSRFDEE